LLVFPLAAQEIEVQRHQLKNGLTLLTQEDHSVPAICYIVFFRVGSRNERPGITGISHLFEHMMFNGSGKFEPKEFDRLLESNGGYSNGTTNRDRTNYWEEVPSQALELVLDLESDRMRSLRLTEENLEQERAIVKEERRVGVDNSVPGTLNEELYMAAYKAHPYRWPVVGWMADLDNVTLQDTKDYFRIYYAPNNAVVVITGAFDTQELLPLMEKYLGDLPPGPPPRPISNPEEAQNGERRVKVHKAAELPALRVAYKTVGVTHEDAPPLEVLATVLARGESSRLFRKLVYQEQVASFAEADFSNQIGPGLFSFNIGLTPGHTPAEAEQLLYPLLEKLRQESVSPRELQKAKNILSADFVKGLKSNLGRAWNLGTYEILYGSYEEMFKALDRINAVSAGDIQRVLETYINEKNRTVVTLVPEAPAAD
jgi:predicted Zn-dependent peptidase